MEGSESPPKRTVGRSRFFSCDKDNEKLDNIRNMMLDGAQTLHIGYGERKIHVKPLNHALADRDLRKYVMMRHHRRNVLMQVPFSPELASRLESKKITPDIGRKLYLKEANEEKAQLNKHKRTSSF